MDLATTLRICKIYSKMSWAIQAQMDCLIAGDTDLHPEAIRKITEFSATLRGKAKTELTELLAHVTTNHDNRASV